MWTEMLHSFYRMPVVVRIGGQPYRTWIRWYKAPEGALQLPFPSFIYSHVWSQPHQDEPRDLGEIGHPRVWDRGQNLGYRGLQYTGLPEWFMTGEFPSWFLSDAAPPVSPECCSPPARPVTALILKGSAIANTGLQPTGRLVLSARASGVGYPPAHATGLLILQASAIARAILPSHPQSGPSGGGGGGDDVFGCDLCPDGAPSVWTLNATGFTGDLSALNGTWSLLYITNCFWNANPHGVGWVLEPRSGVMTLHSAGFAPDCQYNAGGGGSPGSQTFTSSGSWTAPAGVTSVRARAWSGGGGGGSSSGHTGGAGGGGGGGFGQGVVTVVPGTTYAVVIGSGGAGGVGLADGQAGGNSRFGANLVGAVGGQGGLSWADGASGGSGGAGFTSGATGVITHFGGNGGDGDLDGTQGQGGGGGGGAGADAANGGNGGDHTAPAGGIGAASTEGQAGGDGGDGGVTGGAAAGNGFTPGGGGGGSAIDGSTGGDGQPGLVILDWTNPGAGFACLSPNVFGFNSTAGSGGHPATLTITPG